MLRCGSDVVCVYLVRSVVLLCNQVRMILICCSDIRAQFHPGMFSPGSSLFFHRLPLYDISTPLFVVLSMVFAEHD